MQSQICSFGWGTTPLNPDAHPRCACFLKRREQAEHLHLRYAPFGQSLICSCARRLTPREAVLRFVIRRLESVCSDAIDQQALFGSRTQVNTQLQHRLYDVVWPMANARPRCRLAGRAESLLAHVSAGPE